MLIIFCHHYCDYFCSNTQHINRFRIPEDVFCFYYLLLDISINFIVLFVCNFVPGCFYIYTWWIIMIIIRKHIEQVKGLNIKTKNLYMNIKSKCHIFINWKLNFTELRLHLANTGSVCHVPLRLLFYLCKTIWFTCPVLPFYLQLILV